MQMLQGMVTDQSCLAALEQVAALMLEGTCYDAFKVHSRFYQPLLEKLEEAQYLVLTGQQQPMGQVWQRIQVLRQLQALSAKLKPDVDTSQDCGELLTGLIQGFRQQEASRQAAFQISQAASSCPPDVLLQRPPRKPCLSTCAPSTAHTCTLFIRRPRLLEEACKPLRTHLSLGINGMPGIGKTTLAEAVRQEFKISKQGFDPVLCLNLQRNLSTKDILQGQQNFWSQIQPTMVFLFETSRQGKGKLCRELQDIKVLLLDNVWEADTLDWLDVACFLLNCHQDTCLLIISRNQSVLHCLKAACEPAKICMEALDDKAAMALLCHHAYSTSAAPQDLAAATQTMVKECKGFPLALVTQGASLRGKQPEEWEHTIKWLQAIDLETERILEWCRTSYEPLGEDAQQWCLGFAVYPEGATVLRQELINLWSAMAPLVPASTEYAEVQLQNLEDCCFLTPIVRSWLPQSPQRSYVVNSVLWALAHLEAGDRKEFFFQHGRSSGQAVQPFRETACHSCGRKHQPALKKLSLSRNQPSARRPRAELQNLRMVYMWERKEPNRKLPAAVRQTSLLRVLDNSCCPSLEALPADLGSSSECQLQALESSPCASLKRLPDSLGQLCQLQTLFGREGQARWAWPVKIQANLIFRNDESSNSGQQELPALPVGRQWDSIHEDMILKEFEGVECIKQNTDEEISAAELKIAEGEQLQSDKRPVDGQAWIDPIKQRLYLEDESSSSGEQDLPGLLVEQWDSMHADSVLQGPKRLVYCDGWMSWILLRFRLHFSNDGRNQYSNSESNNSESRSQDLPGSSSSGGQTQSKPTYTLEPRQNGLQRCDSQCAAAKLRWELGADRGGDPPGKFKFSEDMVLNSRSNSTVRVHADIDISVCKEPEHWCVKFDFIEVKICNRQPLQYLKQARVQVAAGYGLKNIRLEGTVLSETISEVVCSHSVKIPGMTFKEIDVAPLKLVSTKIKLTQAGEYPAGHKFSDVLLDPDDMFDLTPYRELRGTANFKLHRSRDWLMKAALLESAQVQRGTPEGTLRLLTSNMCFKVPNPPNVNEIKLTVAVKVEVFSARREGESILFWLGPRSNIASKFMHRVVIASY